QQLRAGAGSQNRIEHDVAARATTKGGTDGFDDRRIHQHADLCGADIKIGEYGVDLGGDDIGRHRMNGGHPLGVLRRHRGDDAGAVDAERRERLQIGFDAGAAARIRAGDADRDRNSHQAPRFANIASTARRSARAAAAGSGSSDSAEMTATPSAPAPITAPALLASMPAMPQTGSSLLRSPARRLSTAMMLASPCGPIG